MSYPKFEAQLLSVVGQDSKGLWKRWLKLHPEFDYKQTRQLLLGSSLLYIKCALLMFLAPNDQLVRRVTNWKYSSDNRRQYYRSFSFTEELGDMIDPPAFLRMVEGVVRALMEDLGRKCELTVVEVDSWMRCEQILGHLLMHRGTEDQSAVELFNLFRFHCRSENVRGEYRLGPYGNFRYEVEEANSGFDDRRWGILARMHMRKMVDEEIAGVRVQPRVCISLSEQYFLTLHAAVEGEYLAVRHYEADVLFAAERDLFQKYGWEYSIVMVAEQMRCRHTLVLLARNLLNCKNRKFLMDDEFSLSQLERMIEACDGIATKDVLVKLRAIEKRVHRTIARLKHEERSGDQVERLLAEMNPPA